LAVAAVIEVFKVVGYPLRAARKVFTGRSRV
jgi:hypothetical protein